MTDSRSTSPSLHPLPTENVPKLSTYNPDIEETPPSGHRLKLGFLVDPHKFSNYRRHAWQIIPVLKVKVWEFLSPAGHVLGL